MKATHRNTLESIPWLVTGRIADDERQQFEKHLNECAECRAELELQKRVHAAMTSEQPRVDYAPGASLQKLWNRIGESETVTAAPRAHVSKTVSEKVSRFQRPKLAHWLAAAVVVEAIGISMLAARAPQPTMAAAVAPTLVTVTSTKVVQQTAVIRAVFANDFSVDEMNKLLYKQHLTIIDGPSITGIYTLATMATAAEVPSTIPQTLVVLRANAGVRFAEPIGPAAAIPSGIEIEKAP